MLVSSAQENYAATQPALRNSARFVCVPANYYDLSLMRRAALLAAPSPAHLCKSIIVENTHFAADKESRWYTRHYCVIVQYVSRLDTLRVRDFVRSLNGSLSLQHYNFRFAEEKDSVALTGYTHNAITPLLSRTDLPIILSHRIAELQPRFLWLGGGHIDVKAGVAVDDILSHFKDAKVAKITYD